MHAVTTSQSQSTNDEDCGIFPDIMAPRTRSRPRANGHKKDTQQQAEGQAQRAPQTTGAPQPANNGNGVWMHASLIVGLISVILYGAVSPSGEAKISRNSILAKLQTIGTNILHSSSIQQGGPAQATSIYQGTRLQRLTTGLNTSLHALGASATNAQLEDWSTLVYESMSASSRDFHGIDHVFAVSGDEDEYDEDSPDRAQKQAVQTLSAYFHDIIYYTVDGGLSDEQAQLLEGVIVEDSSDGSVHLSENAYDSNDPADVPMAMLMGVFGFQPGQKLNPFGGLNEFLSAALFIRCLQDVLPLEHMFRIAACIEATVPFRKPDKEGSLPPMVLFNRLMAVRNQFRDELGAMSMSDLVLTVQQAQLLANRDVANFAGDISVFLSNTWNLMPETNLKMRQKVYRISSFAHSLVKMAGFFNFLDPTTIYRSFEGVPSDDEMASKVSKATENLAIAKKYMNAKLLSISVLAALAEKTGGDSSLSMWVGDPRKPGIVTPKMEDDIEPIPDPSSGVELDETVFRILRDGRESASSFDIRNSPLAAFLYGLIGDDGLTKSLEHAVYPMTAEDAEQLLQSLPHSAISRIAWACSKVVASTRRNALEKITMEYGKKE